MAKDLTTLAIEKIKPGSKRKEVPDGRVGNFYFVIQPSGKRSWAFRYRLAGKSYRALPIPERKSFFRDGVCAAKWRAIAKAVARKLDILGAATSLNDLRSPPGNRLEALKADRAGQYSIRVNSRWRVCFVWTKRGPDRVGIVDYH